MATPNELTWSSLTRAINEMKPPQRFLKGLIFGDDDPQTTPSVEISIEHRGREVAPFVKRGSEAYLVGGDSEQFYTVDTPMIRIKRPLHPSEYLFNRTPGTPIFINGRTQRQATRRKLARSIGKLETLIQNAEELLCGQALGGTITYNPSDGGTATNRYHKRNLDAFTIDFTGFGFQEVTLSTPDRWDEGTAYAGDPYVDFLRAQRGISDAVGLNPTHCIMGRQASEAFIQIPAVKEQLDNRRMLFGNLDLTQRFTDQGAHFMGTFGGIQVWEYNRQLELYPLNSLPGFPDESGSDVTPFILDDKAA